MNPWRWVDPRVSSVRVADVCAYLLARGWIPKHSANPDILIFEESSQEGEGGPFLQAIPASEKFRDYPRLISEAITVLSEVEDRHPVGLLNDILKQPQATPHQDPNGEKKLSSSPAITSKPKKRREPA